MQLSPEQKLELLELSRSIRAQLEVENELGLFGVSLVPVTADTAVATVAPVEHDLDELNESGAAPSPAPTPAPQDRRLRLALLAQEAAGCTACVLHEKRTNSVFARGNPDAELVFVGEGPGRDEDLQGLPFVGAAGQLLDKMIAAMGYGRDDVYICNVVKCRPPENRTPSPEEAVACSRFLVPQLQAVAPKMIVALGRCAAQALGVAQATGSWRGRFSSFEGVPVMPTYHPAYLLRSPEQKRIVWEDLQQVMARLGRTPKARR
jgi:uracil-DNA glycosylase family 4